MCLLNRNVGIISVFNSLYFFSSLFSFRICYTIVGRTMLNCVAGGGPWQLSFLCAFPYSASCAAYARVPCAIVLQCMCVSVCIVSVCPWGWKLLHWKRLQLGNQNVHMKVICTLNRIRKLWRYVLRYPFCQPRNHLHYAAREREGGREGGRDA